jgi:environmental stress-induced protein Ves
MSDPSTVRLLRLADLVAVPWKNGGGTTIEYAVHPEGAGFDVFDWRLSRARVATSGPFSDFPGIDRTLAVVAGTGLDLVFADGAVRLSPETPPHAFPGDVAVDGRLVDGPIDDLNLMTRRGRWGHRLERRAITAPTRLPLSGDVVFVVACGRLRARLAGAVHDLAEGDALRLDGGGDCLVEPSANGGAAAVLVAAFTRLTASR